MGIEVKKLEKYIDIYDIFRILMSQDNFKDNKISFLDSSLKNKYGKYSILGINPHLELKEKDNKFYINDKLSDENFEEYLDRFLKENKQENKYDLPLISGGIAYFSYDYGRKFENIKTRHKKDVGIPEAVIRFYKTYIIEDIEKQEIYISYQDKKDFDNLINILENTKIEKENLIKNNDLANFKSNFEKDEYLKAIKNTIDYIIEGDIYIMNLTQRLMIESKKAPLQVFSYLRKFNPAPFGAYLDFDNFEVVSASPERFIKMKDRLIETRPIKGTRKRGATEEEDLALKNELANSEKDKSELLMIVDLERND